MNPYESALWAGLEGRVMRPGGLALTKRLLELSGLPPGAAVLDVGCGLGASVAHMRAAGLDAAGVDRSAELIGRALSANPELPLRVADACALPFEPGFSAVLLECALSETADPAAVLAECHRVLAPGGLAMASDIYDAGSDGFLSERYWLDIVRSAGFHVTLFEGRAADLRSFAAQIVWDYGSLSGFFACENYRKLAIPSYFAMIARKP